MYTIVVFTLLYLGKDVGFVDVYSQIGCDCVIYEIALYLRIYMDKTI